MADDDKFKSVSYNMEEQTDDKQMLLEILTNGSPGVLIALDPSEIADYKFRFELIRMPPEYMEIVLEKALLAYRQAIGKI